MRSKILALALTAAAMGSFAPAATAALQFDRRCTGKIDTQCYHDFCGIADCVRRDCVVFIGVLGTGNTGLCVGLARSADPES